MKLFSPSQLDAINAVAEKSKQRSNPPKLAANSGLVSDIQAMSAQVIDYFRDSDAILITTPDELHDYVSDLIEAGEAGIDTETTGVDRVHDHVVGASLYHPNGTECYIPMRHLVPLFDEPYSNQLTYDDVAAEFKRIVQSDTKLIFANADFDLAMIYNNLKIDFVPRFYYDVILAWRCLKENERDNSLKALYAKYVMKGKVDPKKFSDFFTPKLFPYCKPEVAKLYAANDARITYELYQWQLPYITKGTNAYMSCKVTESFDLGSHTFFVAEIEDMEVLADTPSCTYTDYQNNIKPKRSAAPTADEGAVYRCTICGYEYKEKDGDPANGIAPGTKWEDIPDDWVCPLCKHPKSDFEKVQ